MPLSHHRCFHCLLTLHFLFIGFLVLTITKRLSANFVSQNENIDTKNFFYIGSEAPYCFSTAKWRQNAIRQSVCGRRGDLATTFVSRTDQGRAPSFFQFFDVSRYFIKFIDNFADLCKMGPRGKGDEYFLLTHYLRLSRTETINVSSSTRKFSSFKGYFVGCWFLHELILNSI